jgi:hypothetical protein
MHKAGRGSDNNRHHTVERGLLARACGLADLRVHHHQNKDTLQ